MNKAGSTYERNLLLTLEEISHLVTNSHDPHETLDNIVRLIHGRFGTAVCSVYLLEPSSGELVLGATVGLRREGIGQVRMRLDEGLTGLTAERLEPVMVPDVFQHPRFKYFPESGEDPYHSFLGVPLLESGTLQGVLVVQTVEERTFTPNEIRMLVTVAAQLASLVGDAALLERISAAAHGGEIAQTPTFAKTAPTAMTLLTGVPLSPGTGVGQAYVAGDGLEEWYRNFPVTGAGVEVEKVRLVEALGRAREELSTLSRRISELVGEDHGAILHAQLMIMQDRTIERDLGLAIDRGASAEAALLATREQYVAAFQRVSTPQFQERVFDVKDVFHRLLWQLRPRPAASPAEGDRVVLVTREASVMELFAIDLERLAGVVVDHGGPQSHAAILARSLGIPMVGQVPDFATLLLPGQRLRVDGNAGTVAINPEPEAGDQTGRVPAAAVSTGSEAPADLPWPKGLPRVEVNLNLLYEAGPAVRLGVEGVGLYRSEFLFLARRSLPTEEEQCGIYRKLITQLDGRPVSIRTFDLRPDKLASYSHLGAVAARPFDWRLVLDSLPLQQLFRDQVRAILRAGRLGPVRLLVPLVTRTELLDFLLQTVDQAREDLTREGLAFAIDVPVGIMIETAAAVPLVPSWAKRVNFLALGTNDLTASALGLDRDDAVVIGQADGLHPGVLHLLRSVIDAGHSAGKPVTVCGEMAADPLGGLALAAMGVDRLSVPVNQYAMTRSRLSELSAIKLEGLAAQILAQSTAAAVRETLRKWLPDTTYAGQ